MHDLFIVNLFSTLFISWLVVEIIWLFKNKKDE